VIVVGYISEQLALPRAHADKVREAIAKTHACRTREI
jgi:hypothetical protein